MHSKVVFPQETPRPTIQAIREKEMANKEMSQCSEVSGASGTVLPNWTVKYAFLKQTSITRWDIFFLTMTIVIGGQYTVWGGTQGGFGVSLFSLLFSGAGFACLSLCLSELISTLPFSGGVYGFARAFISVMLKLASFLLLKKMKPLVSKIDPVETS